MNQETATGPIHFVPITQGETLSPRSAKANATALLPGKINSAMSHGYVHGSGYGLLYFARIAASFNHTI